MVHAFVFIIGNSLALDIIDMISFPYKLLYFLEDIIYVAIKYEFFTIFLNTILYPTL